MAKQNALVKVDTVAGSRTFNRLEMQISQTLHMAIELYDSLNYLFVLDHYDDITLFDLDAEPLVVSYYQMKTSDNTITIDSAINGDWLAKLHAQLTRPEGWIVKELGLITNTPFVVSYKTTGKKGNTINQKEILSAERTSFAKLNQSVQTMIKADIASKCGISENEVDLSRFAHLRTTLTIERHRDLVEKEIEDFLYDKYPRITVDTVKGIYSSLIDLLTKRQEYEMIPENEQLEEIEKHKGFTKNELTRVIDKAILLSLPTFDDVMKYSGLGVEMQDKLSFPYVQILTDSNKPGDESFPRVFSETIEAINRCPYEGIEIAWEYGQRIGGMVVTKEPTLCIPYSKDYIGVLTICLLINESRRHS